MIRKQCASSCRRSSNLSHCFSAQQGMYGNFFVMPGCWEVATLFSRRHGVRTPFAPILSPSLHGPGRPPRIIRLGGGHLISQLPHGQLRTQEEERLVDGGTLPLISCAFVRKEARPSSGSDSLCLSGRSKTKAFVPVGRQTSFF